MEKEKKTALADAIGEKLRTLPKPVYAAAAAAFGAAAGFLNGFLGSGGGVILIFAMRLLLGKRDEKDVFATAVLSILPMSAVSVLFYRASDGDIFSRSAPYLLPAAIGGITGALLLSRISSKLLRGIFAALMLWAGFRMSFGR